MNQELYRKIVDAYRQTGSVDRTAELCGTYAIKVRRVLITEGLWHSKKSDAVNRLRERGYSVSEIAETLGMDVKNVQFYLPYSVPVGVSGSSSRERVKEFRERGRKAEGLLREDRKGAEKEVGLGPVAPPSPVPFAGAAGSGRKRHGLQVWSGYQLHMELVRDGCSSDEDESDLFRGVPDADALRRLLKTKNGISRDVIVPGKMSLHQLSYLIQELFGFMNCHLHHFSLPKSLFRLMTEGETAKWAEMCGVYLHVPVEEDFSDLYWDDDYRQGKSTRLWMRSKYTGIRKNYAVGETYIDSMRLLKEEIDWVKEISEEDGDGRSFEDLSLEEYIRDYLFGESNMLLERLKIEDLFMTESLLPEDMDCWRDTLREAVHVSLSYLEAFRKTESFRSLEEAMRTLRIMRDDRGALEQAVWRKRDEVRKMYGRNPDTVLEELEAEIRRTEREIGDAMHAFDPPVSPVTDTLYYHYDYGDGWLFRITCREIFSRYAGDLLEDAETKSALRKVKKKLGFRPLEIDRRLEACEWGKNYLDGFVFEDTRGRELHNMLYLPLCTACLEERPVCFAAEGLSLVEDVGGPDGFFDFIRTIHGEDPEESASLRRWARSLGWKELVPKP